MTKIGFETSSIVSFGLKATFLSNPREFWQIFIFSLRIGEGTREIRLKETFFLKA